MMSFYSTCVRLAMIGYKRKKVEKNETVKVEKKTFYKK